jgi:hypothetical protein
VAPIITKHSPGVTSKSIRNKGTVVVNVTRGQLQPELAQTDLSPDVTKAVEAQLQTLRTSEPRKAEEGERFGGGPLGKGDAGDSRSSGK